MVFYLIGLSCVASVTPWALHNTLRRLLRHERVCSTWQSRPPPYTDWLALHYKVRCPVSIDGSRTGCAAQLPFLGSQHALDPAAHHSQRQSTRRQRFVRCAGLHVVTCALLRRRIVENVRLLILVAVVVAHCYACMTGTRSISAWGLHPASPTSADAPAGPLQVPRDVASCVWPGPHKSQSTPEKNPSLGEACDSLSAPAVAARRAALVAQARRHMLVTSATDESLYFRMDHRASFAG